MTIAAPWQRALDPGRGAGLLIGVWVVLLAVAPRLAVLPVLAGVGAAAWWWWRGGIPRWPWPASGWLAVLGGWAAVATGWAADPGTALLRAAAAGAMVAGGVLLVAVGRALRCEGTFRRRFCSGLVLGWALALAVVLVERLSDGVLLAQLGNAREVADVHWRMVHYNAALNVYGVILFLLPALWRWIPCWRMRGLAVAGAAGFAAVLPWMESGTALVAVVTGAAALGLSAAIGPIRWRRWKMAHALAGAGAGVFLMMPMLAYGAALAESAGLFWGTLAQRAAIWRYGLEWIAGAPYRGWGFRASREIMEHYPAQPGALHPHNGILQLWMELGGIGAAIAAGCMAAILMRLAVSRSRWIVGGRLAALAVLAVTGCSAYGAWQSWWLASLGASAAILTVAGGGECVSQDACRSGA